MPYGISDPRSPLLVEGGNWTKPRWLNIAKLYIVGIVLGLFLAQNLGLVRCPLNDVPAVQRARLRQEWASERQAHEDEAKKWAGERKDHADELKEWEDERAKHQEERDAFEREREDWAKERKKEENHRLDVIRKSQGVYWTEPHGEANCHAYGTRTYSAYLKDIPEGMNWLEVCDNMPPVVIHGQEVDKPSKCERNGNGDVVGVWYVDFGEPNCTPYWSQFYDKGCSPGQVGVQRFEARLDGIGKRDDWEMMCATTPATIQRLHFDRPSSCENRGFWSGVVGVWDFPNPKCSG
ncbi:hypothetical protein C8Q77DRAFT_1091639 [Trametes polyzona]|nr:hypothetical protein C8Q77DRAFT_1091639 [Trametes polyzona]